LHNSDITCEAREWDEVRFAWQKICAMLFSLEALGNYSSDKGFLKVKIGKNDESNPESNSTVV
jgi:hypothetical protein